MRLEVMGNKVGCADSATRPTGVFGPGHSTWGVAIRPWLGTDGPDGGAVHWQSALILQSICTHRPASQSNHQICSGDATVRRWMGRSTYPAPTTAIRPSPTIAITTNRIRHFGIASHIYILVYTGFHRRQTPIKNAPEHVHDTYSQLARGG